MSRFSIYRVVIVAMVLAVGVNASAASIGKARGSGSLIEWQLSVQGHDRVEVRVSTPDGDVFTREFKGGQSPSLRLQDLGSELLDGTYTYELRVFPKVPASVAAKLKTARASNDEAAAKKIMKEAGLTDSSLSGAFTVLNQSIVNTEAIESGAANVQPSADSLRSGDGAVQTNLQRPGKVASETVIPDDLIVQGSTCVGFDCVDGESFGFDTIRLKENNLRIKFEDTSTGTFPTNDWQLTANDSASGGANKFSIEDVTGAKVPVTVTAGAATNSIFIDSTGRVGFRTATPALDLHVSTANSPAMRLEQTNAGGFTAQTWDIAGNEANFFVRDVTGGSRLPFRIRPGALTSSIDISSTGAVGINDASPNANSKLDINGAQRFEGTIAPVIDNAAWMFNESGVGLVHQAGGSVRVRTGAVTADKFVISTTGDVGINCNAPTADLTIFSTTNCAGSGSTINAGATQFTVTSSRAMKENLAPVAVPDLLERISTVGVYEYDFITGPKDRVGLMAEDFHKVLGRGSDKVIDGNDVQIALWLAVQELAAKNKELQERLQTLERGIEQNQD